MATELKHRRHLYYGVSGRLVYDIRPCPRDLRLASRTFADGKGTNMQPSQGAFIGLLKRILFKESIKHPRWQHLWSRLHTIAVFGMNYGGGGLIESSGETWVLSEVVAPACQDVAVPVVFDVGANVGDYSLCVKACMPAARIYAFEPARSVYEQLASN